MAAQAPAQKAEAAVASAAADPSDIKVADTKTAPIVATASTLSPTIREILNQLVWFQHFVETCDGNKPIKDNDDENATEPQVAWRFIRNWLLTCPSWKPAMVDQMIKEQKSLTTDATNTDKTAKYKSWVTNLRATRALICANYAIVRTKPSFNNGLVNLCQGMSDAEIAARLCHETANMYAIGCGEPVEMN